MREVLEKRGRLPRSGGRSNNNVGLMKIRLVHLRDFVKGVKRGGRGPKRGRVEKKTTSYKWMVIRRKGGAVSGRQSWQKTGDQVGKKTIDPGSKK